MEQPISSRHQEIRDNLESYKYHEYLFDALKEYSEDQYLSNLNKIIYEDREEEITQAIRENGKDVTQSWNGISGRFFQAIVWCSIVSNAEQNGYYVAWEPSVEEVFDVQGGLEVNGIEMLPDMDIAVYEPNGDGPIYIFSCKTSLKDRVNQSSQWKLVFDLVNHTCPASNCMTRDYSIDSNRDIKYGLITLDKDDSFVGKKVINNFDFAYAPDGSNAGRSNSFDIELLREHVENGWNIWETGVIDILSTELLIVCMARCF